MTLAMRFRLWARQAPRAQVVSSLVALTAVLALATNLVAVGEDDDGAGVDLTAMAGQTGRTSVAGTTADGAEHPASAEGPGAPAGSLAGASVSDARNVASNSAMPSASGSGEPAEVRGSVESRRTASDQGVTADRVKIGFTVVRTGNLSATGFALGLRQDQQEAIRALVDWGNRSGGANGRTIDYVAVEEDPTNSSTWQPTCIQLTEDEKVFAVLAASSHLGAGNECYIEHRVPQIASAATGVAESMFERGGGLFLSTASSGTRAALNWADQAMQEGQIGPGEGELGLLTDECPQDVEIYDVALKPFLQQHGVSYVENRMSCDIGAAQQQVPAAVLQLRQAGVDRVFLGVIFTTAQTFMQQAEAQGWRPTYLVSDLWGNNLDVLSRNFPPEQFDGTVGATFSQSGIERAGVEYNEDIKLCNAVLTEAGLPPITDVMGKDAEIINHCDHFFLFRRIMDRLGPNPTRAEWPRAATEVGTLHGGYAASTTFAANKFNGGDTYALVEWRRECTCWTQIREHRPVRF